jgi:hypothetical protein
MICCLTQAAPAWDPQPQTKTKNRLGKAAVQVWNGLHLACPHPIPIPNPNRRNANANHRRSCTAWCLAPGVGPGRAGQAGV